MLDVYMYMYGEVSGAKQLLDRTPGSGEEGSMPAYRGTSLKRKRTPVGTYRRPVPRFLGE